MTRRLAPLLVLTWATLLTFRPADASAQDAAVPSSPSLIETARLAEERLDFAASLASYRAAVATGEPVPRIVRRRIAYLEERAEGGFEPLRALELFRRIPLVRMDDGSLDAFEHEIATFPRGRVRVEAHEALVRSELATNRIEIGVCIGRRALELPESTDRDRDSIRESLSGALARAGRFDEARDLIESTSAPDRAALALLASRRRAARLAPVAMVGIALWALAVVVATVRAYRRARPRIDLGTSLLVAFLALAPLAIATLYDHEATDTFFHLALATIGAVLGASFLGRALGALEAPRWTWGLAAASSSVVLVASSYLVLVASGTALSFLP